MTCSLLYSASVPNSVDLYDFQFETCFSMFQTVLMTMMTVMTMTENMFRTPTPSVLICLKQLETGGNFPVLACHFHKLAVTWPGLSSGKFRVRSHERLFPFPLGGGSPLPSRSSLCITLGPSAYGYDRTGNFWSPHRERGKALQWQEPSPIFLGDEFGLSRAPLSFFSSDCGRSCGPFAEDGAAEACACPCIAISRSFRGGSSCCCPRAGLFLPSSPFCPCFGCLARATPRCSGSVASSINLLLLALAMDCHPRRRPRRKASAGELDVLQARRGRGDIKANPSTPSTHHRITGARICRSRVRACGVGSR